MNTPYEPNEHHSATNGLRVRTFALVAAFLIFGFGLLTYQLYVLQLRDSGNYRAGAAQQQLSDEVLPATRGSIYGATGQLLAKSNVVWDLVANPSAITEEGRAYLPEASERIAELIGDGTTAESILAALSESDRQYRVLARGLDMPTVEAVTEYASTLRVPQRDADGNVLEDEDGQPLPGGRVLTLYREQNSVRSYPYGSFLASVLGFCDADGNGMYGLERSYNEQLAGTPGRSVSTRSLQGYELDDSAGTVHPAIDGYDLHLTIDETVQTVLENYLARAVEDFNIKSRACGIVMDVNTGAIYGMATVGQFDPNDPYAIADPEQAAILETGLLDGATTETLRTRLGEREVEDYVADGQIDSDEFSAVQGMMREAQWKNKTLTELYMPGSVFKLITASAALDSGLMTPAQNFTCNGSFVVNAGTRYEADYNCARGARHGTLDLAGALNHSCNLYFIQVGQLISPVVFYDYIQAFGFTEPTGIDLPFETRWTSVYTDKQMAETKTNLYSATFGQNESITPMQMATAVAAVTNGGYLVTPYVVDSVTDQSGNVVQQNGVNIRRQVISEEVSAQMCAMMEDNVGHGTGEGYHSCSNAYVAGYRIGGKSGTAEQLNRSKRAYDGDYRKGISFAAVLPINDPEIEVFVLLDDPQYSDDFASSLVAPVVGNIISEIAPYLGIAQDPDYAPTGTVTVKNCVGQTWTRAQVTCNVQGLGHEVIGEQGDITYQYPYAGTSVPAGSTVYLYANTDHGEQTTVPDVTGKTGTFAVQMLRAAGLNAELIGDGSARVTTQSHTPDTLAEMGTVVTVTTGGTAP